MSPATVTSTARHKQLLGQLRPSTLNVFAIYTAPAHIKSATITLITICETAGAATDFSIYHDDTGSLTLDPNAFIAGDAVKAVYGFNRAIGAKACISELTSSTDDSGLAIAPGGQLGVRAGAINAVTFSVYGYEELPG